MKNHKEKTLTDRIIETVVYRRTRIEKFFILLIIFSLFCLPMVEINYDLTEYLPVSTETKQGIDLMEREFGYPGTARVLIRDVSVYEAKIYKNRIEQIDGVDTVSWADTAGEIYVSNDFLEAQDLDDYYKDGYAVMDIQFVEGDSSLRTDAAIEKIRALVGDRGAYSGPALDSKMLKENLANEIGRVLVFSIVMILLILAATTTSWFEPLLFMLTMGVAILINMGSNIIFGRISFLSYCVAAVLQLAVAMDYSIFLLHTFTAEKARGLGTEEAMENALHLAVGSIVSSAITTVVGFVALALMQFTIGRDIGFVLAKGILCSLVTVLFLMPALIIRWHRFVERSQHRPLIPPLDGFAKGLFKVRHFFAAFCIILIVPAFVAQNMNHFVFGGAAVGAGEGTQLHADKAETDALFGEKNLVLAILPNSSSVTEKRLADELEDLPFVKSVTSLSSVLPDGIPESFLPSGLTTQLHTGQYARMLIFLSTPVETDFTFECLDTVRETVHRYYPQDTYIIGSTPAAQDIKSTITGDYTEVNLISMLGVALVILCSFRSITMTIVVMVPIEVAILFNMALPYVYGNNLIFLGYLMVSSMQLGATVDYSILLTNNYMNCRAAVSDKKAAAIRAISQSALSIMTSGTILTVCGYGLYYLTSITAAADLGRLIGRGAVFSMILVLTLLPMLLTVFDKAIFRDRAFFERLLRIGGRLPARDAADKNAGQRELITTLQNRSGSADGSEESKEESK